MPLRVTVGALPAHSDLESARQASLGALRPIVGGIARALGQGSDCEVVLHDFSDPEHSIIAIAGSVTGRKVGGSVSPIGLSLIAQGDAARDQEGYVAQTRDGRILRSSTFLLRDSAGHVFGALCINIDVTDYRNVARRLLELTGSASVVPTDVNFTDDIHQVIEAVVEQEKQRMTTGATNGTRESRLQLVAALRRRGVFAVQRAVPLVAELLGVSRASVYSYLDEIRRDGGEADGAGRNVLGTETISPEVDNELQIP